MRTPAPLCNCAMLNGDITIPPDLTPSALRLRTASREWDLRPGSPARANGPPGRDDWSRSLGGFHYPASTVSRLPFSAKAIPSGSSSRLPLRSGKMLLGQPAQEDDRRRHGIGGTNQNVTSCPAFRSRARSKASSAATRSWTAIPRDL